LAFACDSGIRAAAIAALDAMGACAVWFPAWKDCLDAARNAASRLILLCCGESLPLAIMEEARSHRLPLPLLFITDQGAESLAIAALRCGAADYFALATSANEFSESVRQYISRGEPRASFNSYVREQLIAASSSMLQVQADIAGIAQSDSNVLITGETGTGKELVASSIHYQSARHARPLTTINCAAIPDGLFESELFGYERGAFTGAAASYEGKVRASDGGSIFLDEVGDLSAFAQAKLLRLIDTKEVQRLGDVRSFRVDVRIIAATHRDLDLMVHEERFRSDLYFRLNVARVRVPALRERTTDIAPIAGHILQVLNGRMGAQIEGFEHDALESLMRYAWPGNVRELRNVLEAILIRRRSGRIGLADLPAAVRQPQSELALPEDELTRILLALEATEWNKSKAAEKLHWSRMTLYRKISKYHVQPASRPAPPVHLGHPRTAIRVPIGSRLL
jgi:DNA-binding NtrC family response regulator